MRLESEEAIASKIEQRIAGWVTDRGLLDQFAAKFPVVVTWTLTCSPKNASVECLSLATMDLYLWFLTPDDYAGPDYAEFYRSVAVLADGDVGVVGRAPESHARLLCHYRAQIERLKSFSVPMSRYLQERKVALAVYERRNKIRDNGKRPTFEDFLAIREVTIVFRLWYTLWEILHGFHLSDEQYESSFFQNALGATTRWQVFINDLHSLTRDMREGMPNLILCLEQDRGMTRNEAVAYLRGGCDELAKVVDAARGDCQLRFPNEPTMLAAIDFLRLNIEGGRELYRRDLDRYSATGT